MTKTRKRSTIDLCVRNIKERNDLMKDQNNFVENLKKLNEYEVMYDEYLDDITSNAAVLRHKKSGARICVISNDDKNKVFSVGFRTTPTDSTGVPHIVEHTVLCGSKKYPIKDPFMELSKGSLNTFLNAMTFPDKTVYPVASLNDKDFANLMDVYMDAVFNPRIYEKEEIFRQDGVRYELFDKDGEIEINGVVYSEMKGAFSDPMEVLRINEMAALMPDNTYGVVSGGDPDVIPSLTYENYLNFHRRYYHPSNSYIYLYGDCNMEEKLKWLDTEYLKNYDAIDPKSEIEMQKSIGKMVKQNIAYPSAPGEDAEAYVSYSAIISDYRDRLKEAAITTLVAVLFSAPGAPVKEALVKAGFGSDISANFESGIQQGIFSVMASGIGADKRDAFYETLMSELKKVAEEGVSKKSLMAAINRAEFSYREADFGSYPKGLVYNLSAYDTWLYDDSMAFEKFHGNELYKKLRSLIDEGYFEKLIKEDLLQSDHCALTAMEPDDTLAEKKEKELKEKLAAYKNSLSEREIEELIAKSIHEKEYLEEKDSPEDIAKIPLLSIEDIGKETLFDDSEIVEGLKVPVIHQNIVTNGITYMTMFFDLPEMKTEELPYVSLLSTVMAYIDTTEHSYLDLNDEINTYTGGITTGFTSFNKYRVQYKDYNRPVFLVKSKALSENMKYAFAYSLEQMYKTKFSDTKRLAEIITEEYSRLKMTISADPLQVAVTRLKGYISDKVATGDMVNGTVYYEFIKKLAENPEEGGKLVAGKLEELAGKLFVPENCFISVTCDEKDFEGFKKELENSELSASTSGTTAVDKILNFTPVRFEVPDKVKNEGITVSGAVNYAGMGGNFYAENYEPGGTIKFITKILSTGFLWDEIRVKGGAYGCIVSIDGITGEVMIVSYRDPHVRETFENYGKIGDFLEGFEADERTMTKFIIGTISGIDRPNTPATRGNLALIRKIAGIDAERLNKTRAEILSCTPEAVHKYADLFRKIYKNNVIIAVGNDKEIKKNAELFSTVRTLV